MYQGCIGTYEQRRKYRYKKKNFAETVKGMVDFFEGFEYGENAVVMNPVDYRHCLDQFNTEKNGELTIGGIPVYPSAKVRCGQAFLTTIDAALKMDDWENCLMEDWGSGLTHPS